MTSDPETNGGDAEDAGAGPDTDAPTVGYDYGAGGLAALMLALAAGCTVAPPKQTPAMKGARGAGVELTVSAPELRVRVRALVDPLCGTIEQAADTIIAEAPDPEVRRQALIWKIDAVPSMREALFRPDPLAAILDAWALSAQMVDYFESGPGRENLGEWHSVALGASRQLQANIERFAASKTKDGDVSPGHALVEEWAAGHPIRYSISGRETVLNEVGEFKQKTGLRKAAGSLKISMQDMTDRIEVYSDQLVKQAGWQAELVALDLLPVQELDGTLGRLPELMDSANRALALADGLPGLVGQEREAVLAALQAETAAMLAFFQSERLETLQHLTGEREAVFEELENARIAATRDLQAELAAAIEALRQERVALLEDAEAIAVRTVDHVFLRLAQLVAGVLVVGLIVGGVALWILRSRA